MKSLLWFLLVATFGVFTSIIGIKVPDPNFFYLLLFLIAANLIGSMNNK